MKKILTIAQREFLMVVGQPAYIITFVCLPLIFMLMGAVLTFVVRQSDGRKEQKSVGVVDRAGVLRHELSGAVTKRDAPSLAAANQPGDDITFVPYADDAALGDLREGKVRALYVIGEDYLQTGVVTEYVRSAGLFGGGGDPGLPALRELLRAGLVRSLAPDGGEGGAAVAPALRRVLEWTEVREMNVGSDGKLRPVESEFVEAGRLMIPLITAFLLTSSIFVSSGYMLRAVVEEKSNRTIEVLFSSVRPSQLLWGKILGLSGAALLQMAVYVILSGLSVLAVGSALNVSPASLALSFLYGAFGFLFYAGLLTGAGVVAGNLREGSQLAGAGGLLAISPLLFLAFLLSEPNGTVARVLSFIPLTAPVTMVFRLGLTDVPVADKLGALVVLAAATYLAVRGAAKLMRTAALLYGKRAGLFEVFQMLAQR